MFCATGQPQLFPLPFCRSRRSALRLRIREISETRGHYSYSRVHVMLRRDNHKRIYRLYSEQGLYPNHV
ncbi:TPA: transposase [Klebsiella variicola]|nr:transposase [Klebsiella variicola]PJX61860.1 hypothetical protein CWM56_27255 [Klebsiella sp. E-Nf3]HBZ7888729.1 transposase [Klebsiella pneumoniae]HED2159131.1 transposase [Klebsiella variicola subsp. variicola]HCQ8676108.1 transposase [Klebsiella variicola]